MTNPKGKQKWGEHGFSRDTPTARNDNVAAQPTQSKKSSMQAKLGRARLLKRRANSA